MKQQRIYVTTLISAVAIILLVLLGTSCKNKTKTKSKTKLENLIGSTNYYRFIDLNTAFNYSYQSLSEAEERLKQSAKDSIMYYTLQQGEAFLNHANLFYLCSRFDSAQYYINKFDSIYKQEKIKETIEKDKTLRNYSTYLKMIQGIQQIETYLRQYNFQDICRLLVNEPLSALRYQVAEGEVTDTVENKKKYKNFYNTEKWLWAKMAYHIKYATYNYHFDLIYNKEEHLKDCFDALSQLSYISSNKTIKDSVKSFDEGTLFHYYYALANTYRQLAKTIASDTTGGLLYNYLDATYKKHEKDTTIPNLYFDNIQDLLRKYYNTTVDKNTIVKYFYSKALEIYLEQHDVLEKTKKYNYWLANFKQDIAVIKMQIDNNEIDSIYKNFLLKEFPLDKIGAKQYLLDSDGLFSKWGGEHIDYFQSGASKIFLANYYYSEYSKHKKTSDLDSAKYYIASADSLLFKAKESGAYSFQLHEMILKTRSDIDSAKYSERLNDLQDFRTKIFKNTRKNVTKIIEETEKTNREKAEKEREQRVNQILTGIASSGLFFIILIFLYVFIYRRKRQEKETRDILSQIIDYADKASKVGDEKFSENSMKSLVETLRTTFKSEYCAIGKVVDDIVEDYACDYEEYKDKDKKQEQKRCFDKTKKTHISNTNNLVCMALRNKKQDISIFRKSDITPSQNYEIYKNALVSKNLSNTIIIPLRDESSKNFGYIQFINKTGNISKINPFKSNLLQLVRIIINYEKNKRELDFIKDSKFIKSIIQQKNNVGELFHEIMEYLSKEFNAAIVSFRIPILDGEKKVPLFYLREFYISPSVTNQEQVEEFYYKNRVIIDQNKLSDYKINCSNKKNVIFDISADHHYIDLKLSLKEQTLLIPIYNDDFDENKCIMDKENPICESSENQNCAERFKRLYGWFTLRLFDNSEGQDPKITEQEEKYFKERAEERLSYLSGQITLIFNSIVDKSENASLQVFRKGLKGQQFLRIKDFDKQFAEIVKKSVHAKECSIYRYRKNDDYSEQIYLSATTSKQILYKGKKYSVNEIIQELHYSITDDQSIVVRGFKKKESKYLYKLSDEKFRDDFIELFDNEIVFAKDESVFLIPIIKKDENQTCLGVVVLFGKEKNDLSLSTSYWEQDKALIEFIVDIFTRISEADNERSTFLNQLGHELLLPITELVQENNLMLNRYNLRKEPFQPNIVLRQLKRNIDNCLSFKYIISDIEDIYSSLMKDIAYKIELQQEPNKILNETIELLQANTPIKMFTSRIPPLRMDKDRIKQVFFNVLQNAIKYSYKDKQVEIYYVPPSENDIGQHEIKFVNYGIGILEEDRNRIFELYKRGKNAKELRASGSGMGLYIVKEIMKAHGGDCIIRKLKNPTEISLIFPINKIY
ncbi:MAG: HAMP domain-containing histidine kinase [Bacteroidales bacterium]|nr:HAMP domain-containing histidine kinase [Bacteroidales bacterium]